ncbi:MAG: hypothetical protein AAF393_03045 [Pseudomonadota bacterium]
MRNLFTILASCLCIAMPATAQSIVGTTVVDGQKVQLLSDNTWRFAEGGTGDCAQLHVKLSFCGDTREWQKSDPPSPDIIAQYMFKQSFFGQYIIEDVGTESGVTREGMRKIAIENAAAAAGVSAAEVAVLVNEEGTHFGLPSDTLVYAVVVDSLAVVFANTIVVGKNAMVQINTFTLGTEFAPEHNDIHRDFVSLTKFDEG